MKTLLFCILSCLTIEVSFAQNILIVDNNPVVDTTPADVFNNFNDAQTAAVNGDIIYVQPSITAYGSVNITKEITVYGIGHEPELNSGRNASFNGIGIVADNVTVSGLDITGSGIVFSGTRSNIKIENNRTTGVTLNSAITNNISIQGNIILTALGLNANPANATNITITHNFFDSTNNNGIQNLNSSTIFNNNVIYFALNNTLSIFSNPIDLVAQNNVFVSTGTFNGTNWWSGGTPITFNNCLSFSYSGITLAALNGSGNFNNTNPQFTSIPVNNPTFNVANDYTIGSGSLGTDGNTIGLFNGTYDFDMRGYPTLLPYISEMTVVNNMIMAGQNLDVNLKANANKTN
ncbi:right-handed parallel beta-helix repeat-containing protein [Aurantibacter aestuarii]|uniref:Right handed beta helix domain-containing protein n=1 Tax=Aurantibacter aestuarii TaxID=1266046 RepID=A0A2T1NA15_9FLAO|nr:hypothetical protein [Aurantibacter aestuarii]PSG88716.1 hypothetical protein C7H52_10530 [Aurantibacter aestuarii]